MTTLSLSQTPDAVNLILRQYQLWNLSFSYCEQNPDGTYNLNAPIDLTGYSPILQFRENALSRTAVQSFDLNNGLTFQADTCPQVTVNSGITCAPGKYVWDLRMLPNVAGDFAESIYLGQGVVLVEAEVSR